PVLLASAAKVIGVAPLADALADLAPSPLEARPIEAESGALSADPAGPTVLRVFKTTADPYVGRLTYFRVVSGTVTSDSHLMNANTGRDERLSQLFVVCGKSQEPAPRLHAGDIGAVAKLAETGTGDTLCAKGHETKLPPIALPSPVYDVAVSPKTKADLDKLGAALTRIVEEDPTLRVHRDATTGETVLSGLGETHVDVAIERMRRKFGVDVEAHTPRVAYRETIRTKANVEYKHKKQTGGHGQYGHVFLELEPLPRGSGVEFGDRVVGGVVPKNYIPAVEKGVMEAVQEGAIANCPLVDMKVTLYDGSHHPVDSSEMAFKIAASQAMKKGVLQANPALLEPVAALHIQVPEEFVGDVISDLNGKRGQVLGMTPNGSMTTIEAMAPLAEVQRYAIDLRSLTQGRASFSMELDHYDEVPQQLAQKVIDEAHREKVAS
ncbi:MAG TPA: elongation factor G, partial [Dehalococcoidia bacterium]|nr:elongation factor G [Dehalococcoidia bacterium]